MAVSAAASACPNGLGAAAPIFPAAGGTCCAALTSALCVEKKTCLPLSVLDNNGIPVLENVFFFERLVLENQLFRMARSIEHPLFQSGPFWKTNSPSEQQNFQNVPFRKTGFSRTARSGKPFPRQSSRIPRTARSGKSDFIERPVLEKISPIRAAEFPERPVLEKMIL